MGGFCIPIQRVIFWHPFCVCQKFFKMFQIFPLTFIIEHQRCLDFGRVIFSIETPIKALYIILTTQDLWYTMPSQSGKILPHGSKYVFVAKMFSTWSPLWSIVLVTFSLYFPLLSLSFSTVWSLLIISSLLRY